MKKTAGIKITLVVVSVFLFVLTLSLPAEAHKVSLWAYVDGDRITGEAYFNSGAAAQNCTVELFDEGGTEIDQTSTDKEGVFHFSLPEGVKRVDIAMSAGMGHVARKTLVLNSSGDIKKPENVDESLDKVSSSVPVPPSEEAVITLSAKELEKIVDRAVAREVAPIKDMLRKVVDPGPRMQDIFGGLGYIIGITSLLIMLKNRKRR